MNEQLPTQSPQRPLSRAEFEHLKSINLHPKPQPQPRPQQQRLSPELLETLRILQAQQQPRYQQVPQGEAQVAEKRSPKPERTPAQIKRLKKITRRAVGASVAAAIAGGAAFAVNQSNFDVNSITAFFGNQFSTEGSSDLGNGMNISELKPLGTDSLKDTQCYLPGAVLMILSIDGYAPLVPVLPGTEQAPYMSENAQDEQGIAKNIRNDLAPFNTEDGYNHATLNDMPLYLTACSTNPNAVQEMGDGSYKIDRSAVAMNFQDPNRLFDSTELMLTKMQDTNAIVKTDPELGEYMTVPMSMYVGQREGDDAYNAAATALNQSMRDPLQLALILASMQSDAVRQIDNVVDGQDNIRYPNGVSKLEEAMDAALRVHLGIDGNAKIDWTGNYPVSMDVARVDGKPVTEGNSLANLRLEPFKITDVEVKYGTPTEPKPKPKPTPSSTPTPEPTN